MAIVVGDIHGCVEKVVAFLDYKPEEKHVALGDYLDSFSESQDRQLQTLRLLLNSDAVLLYGNHDLHYLLKPPFKCPGFQYGREKPYIDMLNAHKDRFLAAYAVDGWLCTHAGVHVRLARRQNVEQIAARLNKALRRWQDNGTWHSMFDIGRARDGAARVGGCFWYDFKWEDGLDPAIKQIFGHVELKEPEITDTYVALNTSNSNDNVYLFDTAVGKLVTLPLPENRKRCKECLMLVDFIDDDGTCTDCG
jgi:hypothetical protein